MHSFSIILKKPNFFYFFLLLFAGCLPLSEFMVSISSGILLFVSIFEDSFNNKILRIKQRKILLLIPSIFMVYLVSSLITKDGETVIYDLKKALFFIILPTAFLLGKEISVKQKQTVFFVFIGSVILATIYTVINWKFGSKNPTIHNASFISHIRFSFQLILAVWFLIFFTLKNFHTVNQRTRIILFVLITGLVGFMFFQQSLTGIISFVVSIIFVLVVLSFSIKGFLKYCFLALILVLTIGPVIYISSIAYPFYHPKEYTKEELAQKTSQGNNYQHDFESRLVENGNLVNLFVCEKEMKEEWNKIASLKYDSVDQFGYEVKSTLVRYLASKGLKKDGDGIRALTPADVKNVENGISNFLFTKRKWSMFPRIYVTIWEYYGYTRLNQVNDQSLSQRIEFSKAAISIIKDNFWLGVGTGHWKQAFYNAYKKMNSNLSENFYASSHNQYLNYLVKFGIIGFLLIMFFVVYPVIKTKRFRDPLFLVFLGFMFVANFADSNLESHMGSSFFLFFYCFFLVTDGFDYLKLPVPKKG